MLARDVYTYYISREILADWRLEETYAQTMYIRLANKLDAKLLVDVSIETGGGAAGGRPTRTRSDISIRRCDPELLKGEPRRRGPGSRPQAHPLAGRVE